MEPGLEQSEAFYSLTYVALFVGHTLSAVAVGLLFNLVPTWYLFLVSTLCHTLGYLLYALVTNGWMMILARGLAGAQMGSVDSIAFAYYSISFEKYTENLKTLGRFEEKKSAKVKGYLFSSSTIGYTFGFGLGVGMVFSQLCAFNPLWSMSVGFPAILAQFPETPQFRPAGWFCVAAGVALLLLQLLLFHGECAWNCCTATKAKKITKKLSTKDTPCQVQICKILVSITGFTEGLYTED